jgi:hypothetical protein
LEVTVAMVVNPQLVEEQAVSLPIERVAAYLQTTLGQQQTAYLAGLRDAKMVGRWARGAVVPRDEAQMRLREAYQAVRLIAEARGAHVAKAWLFGCNARLDDRAPAYLLRHADSPDGLLTLVPTARAFAGASS